jgi:hypothetical protein
MGTCYIHYPVGDTTRRTIPGAGENPGARCSGNDPVFDTGPLPPAMLTPENRPMWVFLEDAR